MSRKCTSLAQRETGQKGYEVRLPNINPQGNATQELRQSVVDYKTPKVGVNKLRLLKDITTRQLSRNSSKESSRSSENDHMNLVDKYTIKLQKLESAGSGEYYARDNLECEKRSEMSAEEYFDSNLLGSENPINLRENYKRDCYNVSEMEKCSFNFIVPKKKPKNKTGLLNTFYDTSEQEEVENIVSITAPSTSMLSENKRTPRNIGHRGTQMSVAKGSTKSKKLDVGSFYCENNSQMKKRLHTNSFRMKLRSLQKPPKLGCSTGEIMTSKSSEAPDDDVRLNISSCKLSNYQEMLKKPKVDLHLLYTPKPKKADRRDGFEFSLNRSNARGVYTLNAETQENYLKMSIRLFYRRRINMQAKPLLIIAYDGVLGFTKNKRFHIRPKMFELMKSLKSHYQLVLTKSGEVSHSSIIIDILAKKGVFFDGFYHMNPDSPLRSFQFCEQIYKDFKVAPKSVPNKVYCLVPINVDILHSPSERSLFTENAKKYTCRNTPTFYSVPLPTKSFPGVPTCLLVQNAKASSRVKTLRYPQLMPDELAKLLKNVSGKCVFSSDCVHSFLKCKLWAEDKIEKAHNSFRAPAPSNPEKPQFSNKKVEDRFKALLAKNTKIQAGIRQYYDRVQTLETVMNNKNINLRKKKRETGDELWKEYVVLDKEFLHKFVFLEVKDK